MSSQPVTTSRVCKSLTINVLGGMEKQRQEFIQQLLCIPLNQE